MKQYMPQQPNKRDFQVYICAFSTNWYVSEFQKYGRKSVIRMWTRSMGYKRPDEKNLNKEIIFTVITFSVDSHFLVIC